MLRFDHVVIAVRDLDEYAEGLLTNHGLDSVLGGRHVGHGTVNRLVPLGPDYLELVAVVDETEADNSVFGRWVAGHSSPEAEHALCLRSSRLDDISKRLGSSPVPMTRIRPDGVELRWRLLGFDAALDFGLPFFIEWDVPSEEHPGRSEVEHRSGPRGISWVELGGERERLDPWLPPNNLDVRLVGGTPGLRRVGIATHDGELII